MRSLENLAMLVSGGGSTMEAIIKSAQTDGLIINPAIVIASNEEIGAIQKAKTLGIKTVVIDPEKFKRADRKTDQMAFGDQIIDAMEKHNVSVITQNGWLPKTPSNLIDKYKGRIFNQHPGSSREFGGKGMYGKRVHAAALLYDRLAGGNHKTYPLVQRVDYEFDKGEVLDFEEVDILGSDTVDDLAFRVLAIEHTIQIRFLKSLTKEEPTPKQLPQIVVSETEHLLEQAKRSAIVLYPHG